MGMWNEKKKGVIFVLVSVFISLIKELSSLLECHARILLSFLQYARTGFPFSSFQKKKEKKRKEGWKQASCNYVLFVLLLCSYFVCECWCIVPCYKRKEKKKKGLAVNVTVCCLLHDCFLDPSLCKLCSVDTSFEEEKRSGRWWVGRELFLFSCSTFFSFSFLLHFWSSHIFCGEWSKSQAFFLYVIERFSSSLCLCLA